MTAIGTPATILGLNAAVEQGTRYGWTYFGGENEVISYVGPAPIVKAVYNSIKAVAGSNPEYDSMMFDAGRGIARLEISKVEDGEPVYELVPIENRIAVEASDYFQTAEEGGDPALDADAIQEVFEAFNEGAKALPATWSDADGDPQTTTDKMRELFAKICRGETEVYVTSHAIRETKRVSKRSTVSASYDNVDRVEAPPDTSAVNSLIGTLPEGEWLKRGPMTRQVGSRRWEIVTEWWWARKWSRVNYGGTLEP